jgi:hypothetical protein
MQLLIVKEHDLYCPACGIKISKLFAEGYSDIATHFHNKEHIRLSLDTPESYNEEIVNWSYPQEIYELST